MHTQQTATTQQFRVRIPGDERRVVADSLKRLLDQFGQPSAVVTQCEASVYEVSDVLMSSDNLDRFIATAVEQLDTGHWEPPFPKLARAGRVFPVHA